MSVVALVDVWLTLPLVVMPPVSVVDVGEVVALPPIDSVLSSAGHPASINPSSTVPDASGAETMRRRAPQCGHDSSCARTRTLQLVQVTKSEAMVDLRPHRRTQPAHGKRRRP
jgi:hypothetical protein